MFLSRTFYEYLIVTSYFIFINAGFHSSCQRLQSFLLIFLLLKLKKLRIYLVVYNYPFSIASTGTW